MSESTDITSPSKKENEQELKHNNDYQFLGEDCKNYDLAFKIILIGNSGVGKTCLTIKGTQNKFLNDYVSTIGFEFFKFNVKLNNNTIIRLQIWDTCGQEIYRSLVSNFYKKSTLAIIVYSIDK